MLKLNNIILYITHTYIYITHTYIYIHISFFFDVDANGQGGIMWL